jgi:hypothetical protein
MGDFEDFATQREYFTNTVNSGGAVSPPLYETLLVQQPLYAAYEMGGYFNRGSKQEIILNQCLRKDGRDK